MAIYLLLSSNAEDDYEGKELYEESEKKFMTQKISHVLTDEAQIEAIAKRIKRAQGQLGAVARMLEEGRDCADIVTQMSAVSKAVNTAAFTLISSSLKECLIENKSTSELVTAQLQKLFLSLA